MHILLSEQLNNLNNLTLGNIYQFKRKLCISSERHAGPGFGVPLAAKQSGYPTPKSHLPMWYSQWCH